VLTLAEQLGYGDVLTVVHVRGSSPAFDKRGGVEVFSTVKLGLTGHVVHLHVGVEPLRMALGATDGVIEEQLLATLGRFAELTVDQEGAGDRLERHEVLVNRVSGVLLFRSYGKHDVLYARSDGGFGFGTNARTHRRRRFVRQQHVLYVLGVAHPVVYQVPV
jgi:hypothetical protein